MARQDADFSGLAIDMRTVTRLQMRRVVCCACASTKLRHQPNTCLHAGSQDCIGAEKPIISTLTSFNRGSAQQRVVTASDRQPSMQSAGHRPWQNAAAAALALPPGRCRRWGRPGSRCPLDCRPPLPRPPPEPRGPPAQALWPAAKSHVLEP